ncbi:hypothetical protein CHELA20_40202 [Hyphomicrobiales bacterium]|nr:hypothetical protein CHELA20_40202 [Hyphomicrobiales bacterium]CAH1686885.1 hypothetical protein CHELA41_30033 [Hyphomicrobiales bacterium]
MSIGRRIRAAWGATSAVMRRIAANARARSSSPYPDTVILSQNQAWGGIIGGSDEALQTSESSVPAA